MSLMFIRVFAGFLSGMFFGVVLTRHYGKGKGKKSNESASVQS